MHNENLADLPEALPLKRVAPAWRVLAVLGGIAVLLLLFAVLSMALLVARQSRQLANAQAANFYGPPMGAPTVAMPIKTGDPDDAPPVNAANLPYPVQDDLRSLGVAQQQEAPEAGNSARARFLAKGREFWKVPNGHFIHDLIVSPDGQSIAYFKNNHLVAGLMANPQMIEEPSPVAPGPVWNRPAVVPPPRHEPEMRLIGVPAWSADSRYVCFGSIGGRMQRFDSKTSTLETLSFRGSHPVPLPNDSQRMVFVRFQTAPKTDAPGALTAADPAEIVIGDCSTTQRDPRRRVQVVVPARAIDYSYPAISADGRWLAIWARVPTADPVAGKSRVFLVDLTRLGAEPATLDIPASDSPGPLCWTKDGKHLIYARGHTDPLPPDCWTDADWLLYERVNLFQWDLAAKTETRLSRGGGCVSPALDRDGGLFFLTWTKQSLRSSQSLRRIPLAAAREFAAAEPDLPGRDGAAWTALVEQIWQEAKAPAAGQKIPLTEELMAQLATSLERSFPQRFKEPLPVGPAGLARLERETRALLPPDGQRRWQVILTAARGEHLRKTQSAVWHLVPEPPQEGKLRVIENANPFAYVVNLFYVQVRPSDDEDDGELAVPDWLLQQAEGRSLVLTNDSKAAQQAADQLVDPDLAKGADLLKQGKTKEGEKLLDDLLKKPQHQRNYHLGLAVGQLLYDQKRFETLHRLMESQCIQQPADARKFNLLGLALLDRQPREAADAFKKALRCDLSYGPGYLNLAQAYRQSNDTPSAVACLRRYLELQPYGPQSGDAAQRLAALEAETR